MKECDVCVCEVLPFTYLSLLCTCLCVVVVNDKYDMFKGLAQSRSFSFSVSQIPACMCLISRVL